MWIHNNEKMGFIRTNTNMQRISKAERKTNNKQTNKNDIKKKRLRMATKCESKLVCWMWSPSFWNFVTSEYLCSQASACDTGGVYVCTMHTLTCQVVVTQVIHFSVVVSVAVLHAGHLLVSINPLVCRYAQDPKFWNVSVVVSLAARHCDICWAALTSLFVEMPKIQSCDKGDACLCRCTSVTAPWCPCTRSCCLREITFPSTWTGATSSCRWTMDGYASWPLQAR